MMPSLHLDKEIQLVTMNGSLICMDFPIVGEIKFEKNSDLSKKASFFGGYHKGDFVYLLGTKLLFLKEGTYVALGGTLSFISGLEKEEISREKISTSIFFFEGNYYRIQITENNLNTDIAKCSVIGKLSKEEMKEVLMKEIKGALPYEFNSEEDGEL